MDSSMFMMWLNLMPWPFFKVVMYEKLNWGLVKFTYSFYFQRYLSILKNVANENISK